MPVSRLVAPGPDVATQTPTRPETRAYPDAGVGGVLLGPHQHMVERTADERVVKRADRRPGIPKQGVDSLQLQALDHSRSSRHHGERPPFRENTSLNIAAIIHP